MPEDKYYAKIIPFTGNSRVVKDYPSLDEFVFEINTKTALDKWINKYENDEWEAKQLIKLFKKHGKVYFDEDGSVLNNIHNRTDVRKRFKESAWVSDTKLIVK